ncbi:MAG: DUF3465 domain-containing protein [Gammaproteobacteria bacterium]|nr:DUF3465 domain-containing protein [Gammaproteobacteria bacterium]
MKKLLLIGIALVAAYFVGTESNFTPSQDIEIVSTGGHADQTLAEAFDNRRSNVQVQGSGEVIKMLADDNDGSRHQKFILRLPSGQTVLVAHNIDLASRVSALKAGDMVEFNGEYEWNPKGGVIHWTHHDPQGSHESGWIRHDGRMYQ